ncbi:MAG: hypothetical protein V3V16_10740 [Melioribacteraceae bacterium]
MKLLVLLLSATISINCLAQEINNISIWGNLGFGMTTSKYSDSDAGFSANYGVSGKYNHYVLSIKRYNHTEFSFKNLQEKTNSISLLLGLSSSVFYKKHNLLKVKYGMLTYN